MLKKFHTTGKRAGHDERTPSLQGGAAGRQRSSAGLQICPAWHRGGMCVLWRLRKTGCTQRAGPRIPMSAQAGPNNVVDIVVLQT